MNCVWALSGANKKLKPMRYHLKPVRVAAIKKSTNNKCRSRCGEKEPSYTVGGNAN